MNENTYLRDLTVGEFRQLLAECSGTQPRLAYGLQGIADLLGVSVSTAKRIKSSGLLRDAISQCGGVIVTDTARALELWHAASHPRVRNI